MDYRKGDARPVIATSHLEDAANNVCDHFKNQYACRVTEHVAIPVADYEAMRRELRAGRELYAASKARATVWTRETYEALIDSLRDYADVTKGGGDG